MVLARGWRCGDDDAAAGEWVDGFGGGDWGGYCGGDGDGDGRKGWVFGKWGRAVGKVVGRWGLGMKPKRLYSSYKTESGQTRYVEREVRIVVPDARIGHVRGEADCWGSC